MFILNLLPLTVRTFSYGVHRYLGNSLGDFLGIHNPELHYTILKTLEGTSMGEASIWADIVKRKPEWSWTRNLHFSNIAECNTNTLNHTGIVNSLVSCPHADRFTNKQLLMFKLHLLQDISQPLHLSDKFRGGNSFKIIRNKNGRNKTTNLHSLWDKEIPWTLIKSGYKLPERYNVSILDVVNRNLNANCDWIFPNSSYILYEDYYNSKFIKQCFDDFINLSFDYLQQLFIRH